MDRFSFVVSFTQKVIPWNFERQGFEENLFLLVSSTSPIYYKSRREFRFQLVLTRGEPSEMGGVQSLVPHQ